MKNDLLTAIVIVKDGDTVKGHKYRNIQRTKRGIDSLINFVQREKPNAIQVNFYSKNSKAFLGRINF